MPFSPNMTAPQRTGVLGSGGMGTGIAQVLANAGHRVVLYDIHQDALDTAKKNLDDVFNMLVNKGKLSADDAAQQQANIAFTTTFETLAGCTLLIEAIVEDLEIKQSVFQRLENLVDDDEVILATNTSSLSVTAIAAACQHPERVIGLHFFKPAPVMKLVEIVPALQTDPNLVKSARGWAEGWRKKPVVVRDTPGFIVNRVARPFYGEALRILEEGIADAATIDWAMTELGGFRMGPFTLMDFIGLDINYKATESVFAATYHDPRYKPSLTQLRLVQAGYLGRKSGRGFYDYSEGANKPNPTQHVDDGKKILDRILVMLINEAADALFYGIASKSDLETAMTTGVNYPKGLLAWADEFGIALVVAHLDTLYDRYREDRYRCSPLLREMNDKGKTFF